MLLLNISKRILDDHSEFTVLRQPPLSPDLNPTEHLWDEAEWEIDITDVELTNLQHLCDLIGPIWTKTTGEHFQHLNFYHIHSL